ncbi:ABC transporter substrate-binding protein [Paenibacillus algorifonticola]|uniref:ABC transporter substrate-binding protein n=1 Tax=Paenibacillus algorifonticola TaxID=684063 RepID=UPI003D2E2087
MFRFLRKMTFFALPLALAVTAGCSSATTNSPSSSPSPSAEAAASAAVVEASPSPGGKTVYPLTIENFNLSAESGSFQPKTQTFEKAPERIVANTQSAAEILIRLGLTDKVVGVAALYGDVEADIAEPFTKIPVLSETYVGKELVVGAKPDIVLGRGDLFADADWGVGTVDSLNELHIATFIQNNSRPGAALSDLYKDIEQMGQIFDVQDKAQELVQSLQQRAKDIETRFAGNQEQSFAFIGSSTPDSIAVYSANNDTFQAEALSLLKVTNSFADVSGEISAEQLVAKNPDFLVISDYKGGPDINESVKNIYENPALQSMSAIQNKKVFIIDFNDFWGYGYHIFDGVEKLGDNLAKASS